MRCKIIVLILFQLLITHFLIADTHIPAGDVSGTWTVDGSPYIVDGNTNIPADSLLYIEPGVQILFSGSFKFKVYGRLLAEGTTSDSIYFTSQDTTIGWKGLQFYDIDISQQDSSKIVYCRLEYGRQASLIYCSNSSSIMINKCVITNNLEGRGISCGESNPTLIDVTISNNTSTSYGGGIYCTDGSCPRLVNVTVVGNNPGGIWCSYDSDPIIENSNITDNIGAGICCTYSSSPHLYNVTISGNSEGGIVCCDNSNPVLENVTISNNEGYGGLYCTNSKSHTHECYYT